MSNQHADMTSSGVENLIQRLREQGVAAGQDRAESIVLDAQKRAEWIIEEAQLEAKQLVDEAKKQSNALRSAGEDALKLATRDALLKLRDTLLGSFSHEVKRVVGQKMDQQAFLEKLILQLAGQVREQLDLDDKENISIFLPNKPVGVDELKNNPDEMKVGTLTHYTAAIAADMLRNGVSIQVSDDVGGGLSVRLEDDNMVIDFTDETLAELLLEHLQPRFRTLLQGIVK
jgi:V/A-type H+-transporting ATPase subunit E